MEKTTSPNIDNKEFATTSNNMVITEEDEKIEGLKVFIDVETKELDEALKKAKELKELLEEVRELIDSLK